MKMGRIRIVKLQSRSILISEWSKMTLSSQTPVRMTPLSSQTSSGDIVDGIILMGKTNA